MHHLGTTRELFTINYYRWPLTFRNLTAHKRETFFEDIAELQYTMLQRNISTLLSDSGYHIA